MIAVNLPARMEFTVGALHLCFLFSVYSVSLLAQIPSSEKVEFMIISEIDGIIMMRQQNSDWTPAKVRQIIFEDTELRIDDFSSAIVVTQAGQRFQLKPNSLVGFDQNGLRAIRGTLQQLPEFSLAGHFGPLSPQSSGHSVCGASRWSGVRLNGPGWLPIAAEDTKQSP